MLNGKPHRFDGQTLAELINANGLDASRVAVEINGKIISKTMYTETVLEDTDVVEVIEFVGGG